MDKWIPINKELPPANEEVLATLAWNDTISIIEYEPDWGGHVLLYEGEGNGTLEDILAWMPLPKPYIKEEGENNKA